MDLSVDLITAAIICDILHTLFTFSKTELPKVRVEKGITVVFFKFMSGSLSRKKKHLLRTFKDLRIIFLCWGVNELKEALFTGVASHSSEIQPG